MDGRQMRLQPRAQLWIGGEAPSRGKHRRPPARRDRDGLHWTDSLIAHRGGEAVDLLKAGPIDLAHARVIADDYPVGRVVTARGWLLAPDGRDLADRPLTADGRHFPPGPAPPSARWATAIRSDTGTTGSPAPNARP